MAINQMDRMFEAVLDTLEAAIADEGVGRLSPGQATRLEDTKKEIQDIHESYLEVLFDQLSQREAESSSIPLADALREIRAKLRGRLDQKEPPEGDPKKDTLH